MATKAAGAPGSRTIIIGPSRSGKTHLLIEVLLNLKRDKNIGKIYLFSPTAKGDPIWTKLKRRHGSLGILYYDDLSEDSISMVEKLIKRKKKKEKTPVVVIDDLGENTFVKSARKANPFLQLSIAAFQAGIIFIALFQKYDQATTSLRENAEFIFVKKIRNRKRRKAFADEFLGIMSEEKQVEVMNAAWTEKFDTLFIDRSTPGFDKAYRLDSELGSTLLFNEETMLGGEELGVEHVDTVDVSSKLAGERSDFSHFFGRARSGNKTSSCRGEGGPAYALGGGIRDYWCS